MGEAEKVDKFLELAMDAATSAGRLLREGIDKIAWIKHKGEINLVTEMDIKSEKLIKEKIQEAYPDHQILAEESDIPHAGARFRWIIDPLDGTTNYAHGFPVFCVSVALEIEGTVELGTVYDPMRDELFTGRRGGGAMLNGERISVSDISDLNNALLATGFPYDLRESEANNVDNWNAMLVRAQAIRRAGSAALDLCYTAMGRFDGFWELKLFPWDVAAGALIVREAGGKVTHLGGETFNIYSREVVATNGNIHSDMIEILAKGKRP
ncbi:inositol monophosphatase [Candidatus Poribacteria bacterium]|nr:inositol monophosphatase [Candidatus Poribacteria bacterium]